MTPQDDSELDRREKMLKEAIWQKLAAPLFCLREMRELVTFDIQQSQDSEREQKLLERILELEAKHLRRCLRKDPVRTLDELKLDRLDSWQEVIDFLKLSGDMMTSIELAQLMPAARRIVEKFRPDLE
jgi:hypothetical protein